ncbi:ABC transporter ATP-binding protein [Comamonas composti]|uniref:ABC transporter ATP-binding protein n=1 Tax=Comamonas composti TaxID=408558 RepID=UPI0004295706|nr:ATP-binding cassette domain-containing protein [Comamonas composti]
MADQPRHPPPATAPFLLQARGLRFGPPQQCLWDRASHSWPAGLCLVRGDEGSGKSSLLRLLSGQQRPHHLQLQAGSLQYRQAHDQDWSPDPPSVFWQDPREPLSEKLRAMLASDWARDQSLRHPHWSAHGWAQHVQALDLQAHMAKPLLALSTGTLRKLFMAAAWASGATLVLMDEPLAALDRASVIQVQKALAEWRWSHQQERPEQPPRCIIVAHWDAMEGAPGLVWDQVLDLPVQDIAPRRS